VDVVGRPWQAEPSVSARANSSARRTRSRRHLVRRRRVALLLGTALLVGVVTALALPTLHRTIDEIALPLRHDDIIRQQAAEKNLNPALLAGVIFAESKFRDQTSPAGAKGLMQLTPATARYIAHLSGGTAFRLGDLSTPQVNISYGAFYLRYLLNRYSQNIALALAAYNGGEGNVDHWVAQAGAQGRSLRVRDIPFPETRAYVKRVLDARSRYAKTYKTELGL
jgi:soluble lytic murein transglycosylase